MRFGFIGTQSTGKSALLTELRKTKVSLHGYKFADSVTRSVEAAGFKIKEDGDDATQMQIARMHAENVILYNDLISDRTILDCLAYSIYLYRDSKISFKTLDRVNAYKDFLLPHFDYLFYLPIEFDNVDDGTRSTDMEFRKEIDYIIQDIIGVGINVPFMTLTGSVERRADIVLNVIKGLERNG